MSGRLALLRFPAPPRAAAPPPLQTCPPQAPTPPPLFHYATDGVSVRGNRGKIITEFCEGLDLHRVLRLTAAGSQERLFGWYRRGRLVAVVSGDWLAARL